MSATIPSELSTFATFHNVINGELRESNQTHRGVNSRTEEALWPVPVARSEDLDEAVQAAQDAFKSWSKTPVSYRQDLIRKLATELLRYKQPLFEVIAQETGKSVRLKHIFLTHRS
jgi:acyl-CoA reductase-like NAD-dependent aldehyde dehydrogenase